MRPSRDGIRRGASVRADSVDIILRRDKKREFHARGGCERWLLILRLPPGSHKKISQPAWLCDTTAKPGRARGNPMGPRDDVIPATEANSDYRIRGDQAAWAPRLRGTIICSTVRISPTPRGYGRHFIRIDPADHPRRVGICTGRAVGKPRSLWIFMSDLSEKLW
jgi:hypothetical protein